MSAPTDVITPTPADVAVPPDDFVEFQAFRRAQDRGEQPPKKEEPILPEAPVAKPAKADEPPAKTAAESGTEEEEEQETGEEESPAETTAGAAKPKRKGGFQKRIDRLTREKAELDGRLRALEERLAEKPAAETPGAKETKPAQVTADREPEFEDAEFQDKPDPYGEWMKSWNRWDRRQEAAKVAEAQRKTEEEKQKTEAAKTYEIRKRQRDLEVESFRAKPDHADWDDRMAAVEDVELTPHLDWLLFQSGPELAYHLAGDRAELERIVGLGPLEAARELGKIEARLASPETPAPDKKSPAPAPAARVTSAPKPITPVGGATAGGTPSVLDDKLASDFSAWRNVRRAQLQER